MHVASFPLCREKNAADIAKADASIADAREKFGDVEVFDRQIEKAQLYARIGDLVSQGHSPKASSAGGSNACEPRAGPSLRMDALADSPAML